MSTTLNYYRFLVEGDSTYKYNWLEEPPEVHEGTAVVSGSVTFIDSTLKSVVSAEIVHENTPTGGHYGSLIATMDAPASGVDTYLFTKPFPVSLRMATILFDGNQKGDEFEIVGADDVVIGVISDTAVSGTNEVFMEDLSNVEKGFQIKLDDGVTIDDLGYVTEVTTASGSFTVQNSVSKDYEAGSPTLVKLTVPFVEKSRIGSAPTANLEIAESITTGKYLPANTPVSIKYYNNSDVDKSLSMFIEYLY